MNINCEIDKVENGAPLAFDKSWNFDYQAGSPALSGGVTDFTPLFPESAKTSLDYTMSQTESAMKNEGDELSKGYMVSEHIGWEWKWKKQLKGTLRVNPSLLG